MKKVLLSVGMIALLSGCAHLAPKAVPLIHAKPRHRAAIVAPAPVVVAPVITPAPVVVPAPAVPPAKTFKQRWLSKFFRDRASK